MDCTKCGNPNVIIKKEQSGQYLCKDCFIESIEKKVIKTIRKEKLLDKGDKVLVALSGGKDSVTTLEILNSFREMNIVDLCAVTVDEGIDNYRQDGVDIAIRHAERLGIEHKIVSLKDSYGITLDEIMKKPNHKGSCSYCGVFRRTIINKAAREMGATKIATGHNLDDEVQAIMMNYLEGNMDNLTKLGAKTESKAKEFTVKIKPLREIPEREIGLYVVAKDLEVHFASCPYAQQSFRGEVSEVINQLNESHPTIKYSTLRGYDKKAKLLKDKNRKADAFETGEQLSITLFQMGLTERAAHCYPVRGLSKPIIPGQSIDSVPINDSNLGFFFRMYVELIKNHHLLLLRVVERPLMRLSVRRDIRGKRRITALCKLEPHFAQGLSEGLIKRSSRKEGLLRMVEY